VLERLHGYNVRNVQRSMDRTARPLGAIIISRRILVLLGTAAVALLAATLWWMRQSSCSYVDDILLPLGTSPAVVHRSEICDRPFEFAGGSPSETIRLRSAEAKDVVVLSYLEAQLVPGIDPVAVLPHATWTAPDRLRVSIPVVELVREEIARVGPIGIDFELAKVQYQTLQ
jgi:hypothetical protein